MQVERGGYQVGWGGGGGGGAGCEGRIPGRGGLLACPRHSLLLSMQDHAGESSMATSLQLSGAHGQEEFIINHALAPTYFPARILEKVGGA